MEINLIPKWKYPTQRKCQTTVGGRYEYDKSITGEKFFEEINIWLPVIWKQHKYEKESFVYMFVEVLEHEFIHKLVDDEGIIGDDHKFIDLDLILR